MTKWHCECGRWNLMSRAFCDCGKFWQATARSSGLVKDSTQSSLPMIPEPDLTPEERARLSEALRRGDGPPISPSQIEVYVVMLMYDLDQAALAAFTDEGEARAWAEAYLGDEFSAAAYRAGERGSRWSVVHLPAKHESPF